MDGRDSEPRPPRGALDSPARVAASCAAMATTAGGGGGSGGGSGNGTGPAAASKTSSKAGDGGEGQQSQTAGGAVLHDSLQSGIGIPGARRLDTGPGFPSTFSPASTSKAPGADIDAAELGAIPYLRSLQQAHIWALESSSRVRVESVMWNLSLGLTDHEREEESVLRRRAALAVRLTKPESMHEHESSLWSCICSAPARTVRPGA
eukprot:265241-Pleurochrysis_carterae.AAC.1